MRPNGTKAFLFRYTLNGRREKLTFGAYPDQSLKDARKALDAARTLLAAGKSPLRVKRVTKDRGSDIEATVAGFAPRFIADVIETQKRPNVNKRRMQRHILPTLGALRLDEVEVSHLRPIIDTLKGKGRVQEARHVLILARSLFAHAVGLQHVKHNPARDIVLKSIGAPGERDRALTRDELRQFFAALNAAAFLNPTHVLAMRLLLLTLCRKGELVKARWEHVDFDARTWTAPPEDQKVGIPHMVPLSSQALAAFRELKVRAFASPFVLASLDGKLDRPMADSSLNWAQRQLTEKRGDTPPLLIIPHFVLHDFRRTCSTLLHEAGYRTDWIEKSLGHTVPGVRGIYNKAAYLQDRADMLQVWADELDALGQPAKGQRPSGAVTRAGAERANRR